jgi:two-component system sensor histidine kinase GlrK
MVAIAAALLAALILLLLGRRLMARLLSRVEGAVQGLGEGQLDRKITLRGPDDLRRIGERLEWLRCRLRDLEDQRTRVLRHISHELKTPLAALREGSSLLSDQVAGSLTAQQSRIVGIMHGNALRLQTLIDGLLRLQRAEHALEHFERVRIRLDNVIQQILATHQLAVRDKRLRIMGTLAPLTVTAGREEITTIVSNLVANAIKYSPAGGIINLSLTRDGDQAVFDVVDQGPGIPKEDRKKIFEPFFRARATADSVAGTGLGLAIASEFVHAHHGLLTLVDSGTGAHFQVRLPLSREQQ